MTTSSAEKARRRYRRLLFLYPADFRDAHGDEMEASFLTLLERDEAAAGPRGRMRCWIGASWDALRTGLPMRLRDMTKGKGGGGVMSAFLSDVRFAVRSLVKRPVFALTAIATLALGIGATASIFTISNGLLFAPLPYEDPDELAIVMDANPELGWSDTDISPANAWDWRSRSRSLEDLAVYYDDNLNLTGLGEPVQVTGIRVTPNVFRLLGRTPVLGRDFGEDEVGEGRNRVVILTDGFWDRRFGRDPSTLGSTLILDGNAHTVVGILPPDFVFLNERPDLFAPLSFHPEEAARDGHYALSIARLSDGSTLDEARAELTQIAAQLASEYPDTNAGWTVEVRSAREDFLGDVGNSAARILLGAVFFVLLMACVNVANLLLARGGSRVREIAVRSAMGAGRGRVLRQLLTESLVLAFVGGTLGFAAGIWGARAIAAALPSDLPPVFRFAVDGNVLGFVVLVTVSAAVLFGFSPALHLVRSSGDALRGGGRHGGGRRGGRFGSTLVVIQTSLAMVLLVGGGLLMKSIAGMRNQDFGFDPEGVLTVRIAPASDDYPEPADVAAFWDAVEDRVGQLASVQAVGTTQSHPLMGSNWGNTIRLSSDPDREVTVRTTYATEGFFHALGVEPVRGRLLSRRDGIDAPRVALVNEAFVDRYLPGVPDPLSPTILRGSDDSEGIPIVGIVPNMIERGVDDTPEPNWYIHAARGGFSTRSLVVRTSGDPVAILPQIQDAVWAVDPDLPLYQVESMENLVARRISSYRLIANLMGGFALMSLILGAVGIYGVTAYSAGQRGQEIGLRKALGAEEGQVVSMVVRSGALRAGLGLVLGLAAAFGVARLLGGILVGVSPWDPTVFASVAGVLGLVSLLGLWIPARRAATVDPVQALTSD